MMNVGQTTKSWGTAQEQKLPTEKGNKMSANDKPFGDKDLGTVLNEIADPNYIDPSKVQRENKSELDKDAFFKLMLTQMKNQDPMNPMQSHEMAAHLAQFTSLEQMFNINSNLEAMRKTQSPLGDYQALSFIGKEISADSSMVVRYKDDPSHELRFGLGNDATEAKVIVKNEQGETVRTLNLTNLKKGSNAIRWDGLNENGQSQIAGEYKFTVEALTPSGSKIAVDTSANGRITGVQFTKKGPMLLVGNQQVYLSDVKKITENKDDAGAQAPGVMMAAANAAQAAAGASGPAMPATGLPAGMQLPNGLSLAKPVEAPKPHETKVIPPTKKEKPDAKSGVSMKAPELRKGHS
jgi:flagellar basal-body rod modification protein FlgD